MQEVNQLIQTAWLTNLKASLLKVAKTKCPDCGSENIAQYFEPETNYTYIYCQDCKYEN